MTLEYAGTHALTEATTVPGADVYAHPSAHLHEMGKRVIGHEGFVLLGEVGSPYDYMRSELQAKVVDQPAAMDAIVEAFDRVDLRLPGDHRPIANFGFLGPTGTGKSATAKTLAAFLCNGEPNLIEIDCSNYSNGHEVTSLVGAPPSFVGHDQEPQLAKDKVEVPGTVVLFDEIEKGSSKLYNLMLQIMGNGVLKLARGEEVSFRDTVIILTSNLGAKEMSRQQSATPLGFADRARPVDTESLESVARKSFEEHFTPEFVNRLNKMVVFQPLTNEGLGGVLDVKLAEANEHYEAEYGIKLSLSDETRSHLIEIAAADRHLGARPLVRALEDNVQSMLGRYKNTGKLPEGTHIRVVHRSEVPDTANGVNGSPLLFTAQADASIRKRSQILALPAAMATPEGTAS